MFTIISFNLSLTVLFLIIYAIIWSILGRKLFFDFTYILLYRIILFPILMGIINIIYIKLNNLDAYNYLIPLAYFLYPFIRIYISNKIQATEDKTYKEITPQIRLLIKNKAAQLKEYLEEEDISIIKRDEKRNKKDTFKILININLNNYNEKQFLEKIEQVIFTEIPNIEVDVYIDEKEDKKKHSTSIQKFVGEF
ncbi:RNA helicase [Priestia megaterium]|uniref:RNA helicase n=1 Tax=Priestia megaterium TaxID=1404 RepID=UPI0025A3A543|nr:RNA helicase [Priestia megaterium]MDM8151656.1 RNA helicase [Priestia megaterium]